MLKSRVFYEDCMEGMARFPTKYFDLAPVDIPYGIGADKMAFLTEKKNTVTQKNGAKLNANVNKNYSIEDWDNEVPPQEYYDELCRISKHQIIFGIEYTNWTNVGTGRIIWNKGFSDGMSFKKTETAYCSIIDDVVELPLLWAGMMQAKSLNEPMVQQGNKKLNEKRIHPCHKPVLLYKKLFLDYGFRGMRVLDTHLGGGSSRIAAHEFDCEFVGFENNINIYQAQEQRWKQYMKKYNDQFRLNLF